MHPSLPPEAAVDIAAAHLFGLFRNLRLPVSAQAVALSVQSRAEGRYESIRGLTRLETAEVSERANGEMQERTRSPNVQADHRTSVVIAIDTDFGSIDVKIAEPLTTFARRLWSAEDSGVAAEALQEADAKLDDWENLRRASQLEHDTVILPCGIQRYGSPLT
jgi:hypothetical protein